MKELFTKLYSSSFDKKPSENVLNDKPMSQMQGVFADKLSKSRDSRELSKFIPIVYMIFPDKSYGSLAKDLIDSDMFNVEENGEQIVNILFAEPLYSTDLQSYGSFEEEFNKTIISSKHVKDPKQLFDNTIAAMLYSSVYNDELIETLVSFLS